MKPILLVDDEAEQLRSLRVGLTTKGFEVIGVSNGPEALRCLSKEADRVGLVLTDYAMPVIDGLTLLERIKELGGHIPVIMMTAYGLKSLVIRALRLGCDGFIEKPFTLDEVIQEIRRVEELNQRKPDDGADSGLFPSHVHQLNNHLLTIQANAELSLLHLKEPDSIKSRLDAIIGGAKKINEINRRILQLGRRSVFIKERINLTEFLEHCLELYEIVLQQNDVALEKDLSGLFIPFLGDPFYLEQVFSNLIINAVQAMENAPQKILQVMANPEGDSRFVSIMFRDTGCGIPEQSVDHIFKPYWTSKKKGTGLGLHVVRTIVNDHGGEVIFKSSVGTGTTFTIRLPLAPMRRRRD